jgi:hypothetical protein
VLAATPALLFQRHNEIPVTADTHCLTAGLVDRSDHRSCRAVVEIEQMVLEVDSNPVFTLHAAEAVDGRLGDLGNLCGPIEFGGIEVPRRRPQHPEWTDDLAVQIPQRLADTGSDRIGRLAHHVPVARAEIERIGDDHRLAGLDDIDGHDRGVHRRDVVAIAYFRGDQRTVFESEVLPFRVKQSQADDRYFARPERSAL